MIRWLIALGVMMLASLTQAADSKHQRVIRLGAIDESFYEVVGQVVAQTLTRRGYTIQWRTGSHTDIYEALGRGDIDLCVAFWLPDGHKKQWAALSARLLLLGVGIECVATSSP